MKKRHFLVTRIAPRTDGAECTLLPRVRDMLKGAAALVLSALLGACTSGTHTHTKTADSSPHATADASPVASEASGTPGTQLPSGAVTPNGCDAVRSFPLLPRNAPHLAPSADDRIMTEHEAICVAERFAADGLFTHPAWAWLTTRATIARFGWDGCLCNNRARQVWVVAVAGETRTEGNAVQPPGTVLGYSLILDGVTGQFTDEDFGDLQLRGGRVVKLTQAG
jgi:hypothetical protein